MDLVTPSVLNNPVNSISRLAHAVRVTQRCCHFTEKCSETVTMVARNNARWTTLLTLPFDRVSHIPRVALTQGSNLALQCQCAFEAFRIRSEGAWCLRADEPGSLHSEATEFTDRRWDD